MSCYEVNNNPSINRIMLYRLVNKQDKYLESYDECPEMLEIKL